MQPATPGRGALLASSVWVAALSWAKPLSHRIVRGLALRQRIIELQLLRGIELELRLQAGDYRHRIGVVAVPRAIGPRIRGDAAKRDRCKQGNQDAFHGTDLLDNGFFAAPALSGVANDADRRRRPLLSQALQKPEGSVTVRSSGSRQGP